MFTPRRIKLGLLWVVIVWMALTIWGHAQEIWSLAHPIACLSCTADVGAIKTAGWTDYLPHLVVIINALAVIGLAVPKLSLRDRQSYREREFVIFILYALFSSSILFWLVGIPF